MDIAEIDRIIVGEVHRKYQGYKIEDYASGFGFGIRDKQFDVFLKDGSRFIADAKYDTDSNTLKITEREFS